MAIKFGKEPKHSDSNGESKGVGTNKGKKAVKGTRKVSKGKTSVKKA